MELFDFKIYNVQPEAKKKKKKSLQCTRDGGGSANLG